MRPWCCQYLAVLHFTTTLQVVPFAFVLSAFSIFVDHCAISSTMALLSCCRTCELAAHCTAATYTATPHLPGTKWHHHMLCWSVLVVFKLSAFECWGNCVGLLIVSPLYCQPVVCRLFPVHRTPTRCLQMHLLVTSFRYQHFHGTGSSVMSAYIVQLTLRQLLAFIL